MVAACVSLELDCRVLSLWGAPVAVDGCGLAMEELCSGPGFTNFSKYWWVPGSPSSMSEGSHRWPVDWLPRASVSCLRAACFRCDMTFSGPSRWLPVSDFRPRDLCKDGFS